MIPDALASAAGRRLARQLLHPPRKQHHRSPDDHGLPATALIARSPDGVDLHLWLIPGSGAGTVVVGHGIGLTKSASLRQVALLHESGYHVVMLDHRNHGLSGADRSRQHLAQRYSSDIGTAVEAAHTAWPHSPKLIVWGFSFSTFPTLHSLRHPCTPIHGIICDSGPGLDLETMLQDFLTGGNLPAPPGTRRFLRSRKVADAFAAAAIAMLGTTWPPDSETSAASSVPMLFLVGREDRVVAPEQIRALAARYPRARHAEFPADHLESVKAAPEAYREAVGSFLASLTAPEPHG